MSWAAAENAPATYGRLVSVSPSVGSAGERVRWRTLVNQLGLLFHEEFNAESLIRAFPDKSMPRYLLGPEEGTLDQEALSRMIMLLEPHTPVQRCFFSYDVIATNDLKSGLLFEGRLEDVAKCFKIPEVRGSPTYWWPENRTWLVCTDWDLPFTLLGGAAALIADVVSDPELETIAVHASTRIDFNADRINL